MLNVRTKGGREGLYQCNSCREQFTVTVGTLFEKSKIPLNKWLLANHLLNSSKKGFSAHRLHRTLGWFQLGDFGFHGAADADDFGTFFGGAAFD